MLSLRTFDQVTYTSTWILIYSPLRTLTQDHLIQAVTCQMGNCFWVGSFHGDQPQLLMCLANTTHTHTQRCGKQLSESNDKRY